MMDDAFTKAIAAELRAEAARQKITGRELSRRTGIPASNISRYLNGEGLGFDQYVLIMRAMGKEPATVGDLIQRYGGSWSDVA
jgi:transcriptional regulator with XRE-family HTH domain